MTSSECSAHSSAFDPGKKATPRRRHQRSPRTPELHRSPQSGISLKRNCRSAAQPARAGRGASGSLCVGSATSRPKNSFARAHARRFGASEVNAGLCHFACDPARHFQPRSKIAPPAITLSRPLTPASKCAGTLIYWHWFVHANDARRLRRRRKADCIMRVISRRAADVRVGPAPRAHGTLLSRCMRCVQWLANRQRERINILQAAPFTI